MGKDNSRHRMIRRLIIAVVQVRDNESSPGVLGSAGREALEVRA